MQRIETVQALRFFAAGLVVLAHCASGYFLPGVAGVDIFFVISGFIIVRIMGNRSPRDFAIDRLSRIYPIYWLALAPMVLLYWTGEPASLLTSLTLWPWYGQLQLPLLTVGWTLSYELLFYLCAGLVLWRRWMLVFLLLVYALLMIGGGALRVHPLLGYLGNPLIFEFLLGVGIARLRPTQYRTAGAAALSFGVVAIPMLAHPSFGTLDVFAFSHRALVWGPPSAMILWGALQWEGAFKGLLWRVLVQGGDASYSLYLFHPLVLLLAPTNPYLKLLVMPPICVAASFLIHRWIEKPLTGAARRLAWPKRIVRSAA